MNNNELPKCNDMFDESKFKTKKELYDFLIENKETLITQKKASRKEADGILYTQIQKKDKIISNKANEPIDVSDIDQIKVIAVINTTNIMDSHKDVHLPGIWNKSLKENRFIMHVQEHRSSEFDKIISEGKDLKAYTADYKWTDLGYDFEGKTQALMFESIVRKNRNPFMFNQYAKGYVKNHSVGMYYVKLDLAINDKDYSEEFEIYEKYINQVANKKEAESNGYFWVVKEAKIIEGSAVPLGSNYITPTIDNNAKSKKEENIDALRKLFIEEPKEPESSTHVTQASVEFLKKLKDNL